MEKACLEGLDPKPPLFFCAALALGLAGFMFFFFVLDRGGTEICLDVCIVALVMLISLGAYNPLRYAYVAWSLLVVAGLGFISLVVPWANTNTHDLETVLKFISVVLSIHYLSIVKGDARTKRYLNVVLMALLLMTIVWQFVSCVVFHMPFGMFTNPHYLGSVSILTLPLVFYFVYISQGLRRIIFSVAGVLNVGTLVLSNSRPAWISITISFLVGIFLVFRGRKRWAGLLFLVITVTFLLGVDGVARWRMEDLLQNISREDRVSIWKDALVTLENNTLPEWAVGHGIGSARAMRYSNYPTLHFPHNFLIELMYSNGVIGVFLVLLPLAYLCAKLLRGMDTLRNSRDRVFLGCLLMVFIAWLLHAGVVFPVYSRRTLYPFSLIFGCMVAWGERLRCGDLEGACPEGLPRSTDGCGA